MSAHKRKDLVNRVNQLIIKHELPVPRFVDSHFINYQFWSFLFTKLFQIKCDTFLRSKNQRIQSLGSCLNVLESLIGISLNHIKPIELLNYDISTMINLVEIAEFWSEYNSFSYDNSNDIYLSNRLSKSEPNIYVKTNDSQGNHLAELLIKALKNQIIAIEIGKKIKAYLGDVTNKKNDNLRASRQSIVRTRAIQPLSTFDFRLTGEDKQNPILSVELERWFPNLSNELLIKIKFLEQHLFLSQKHSKTKIMDLLKNIINKQRQEKIFDEIISQSTSMSIKELRLKRASLHDEINKFHISSTAAYLNARSYLENILVNEFRNCASYQRDHINEIKRYLRNNTENMELERVRNILDEIEKM